MVGGVPTWFVFNSGFMKTIKACFYESISRGFKARQLRVGVESRTSGLPASPRSGTGALRLDLQQSRGFFTQTFMCVFTATIALVLLSLPAVGQTNGSGGNTIIAAEYFIDNDPGEGKGFALNAQGGVLDSTYEEINAQVQLPADLPHGYHTLFIRLKSSMGVWGLKQGSLFQVTNNSGITAAEYYVDNDPGGGLELRLIAVVSRLRAIRSK